MRECGVNKKQQHRKDKQLYFSYKYFLLGVPSLDQLYNDLRLNFHLFQTFVEVTKH